MNENVIAHNTDSESRTQDVTIQDNLTFQSMFLSEKVLEGLTSCGFRKPSPVQLKGIPVGRCGFDLIVKSKAGTGKTVVISVISLEIINTGIYDLQVLILAPTREISVQIADVISSIGKHFDDLKVSSFIGGLPEKDDVKRAKNCHIAVGAPGRIKSLIKQNILKLDSLKLFILDEADKLMDSNFLNDLNEIYHNLPSRKQIIATSATFPNELNDCLSNYMQSPTQITVELESPLLLGLKQYIKEIRPSSNSIQEMKHKNKEILQLLETISFTQCLIFSNYQSRAETVSLMLNRCGWNSTFISAAQTQVKRLEVMDKMKNFKSRILLSTDLTARGIDVANIDLIINYDVPSDVMTYLHRMGRAGRYGSRGLCITLISGTKDKEKIQKFLGVIGGTSLSIPKLPDMQRQIDLWNLNIHQLEQLSGIVEEDDVNKNVSFNIENDILMLNVNKVENPEMVFKNTKNVEEGKLDETFIDNNTLKYLNSLHINEEKLQSSLEESQSKGMSNFQSGPEFEGINLTASALPSKNLSKRLSLSTKDKKRTTFCLDNWKNTLISLSEGKFDFVKLNDIFCQKTSTESMNRTKEREASDLMYVNIKTADGCKNTIFMKNKALYDVGQILTRMDFLNSDTQENLNKYLNCLTDQNSFEEHSQICEISNLKSLNSVFQLSSSVEGHNLKEVNNKFIEHSFSGVCFDDIFVQAYQFSIDNEIHWKFVAPEFELDKKNRNNQLKREESDEYVEDSSAGIDESYDSFEIQYNENGKRVYAYDDIPNRMVWVPVEKNGFVSKDDYSRINLSDIDYLTSATNMKYHPQVESSGTVEINGHRECKISTNEYLNSQLKSDQSLCTNTINVTKASEVQKLDTYSYHDYFVKCFDQCSEELWHNGWRFNSVGNFDNWFYDWHQRVQHVSDYIRQNIYVKELSDYQNKIEQK